MRRRRDGVAGVLSGLALPAAQARGGNGSSAGALRADLTTCHGASLLREIAGSEAALTLEVAAQEP